MAVMVDPTWQTMKAEDGNTLFVSTCRGLIHIDYIRPYPEKDYKIEPCVELTVKEAQQLVQLINSQIVLLTPDTKTT